MKLLAKTVASTAVVLVTLAGCASRSSGGSNSAAGSGNDAPSSASSSAGTTSTTNGLVPSTTPTAGGSSGASGSPSGSLPGSTGTSPTKPDPSAQVKMVSPQGVSLAKDGITLVTEVEWGGCDDEPQLIVTGQDAAKVVVELKTTSHARIGVMCPDIARQDSASVKLAEPLGTRQVIDGVKNVPITVH